MASIFSTKHVNALRVTAAVGVMSSLLLVGCGAADRGDLEQSSAINSADSAQTSTVRSVDKPDEVVEVSGVLIRPYSLPTLEEFVRTEGVKDVVIGTVVSSESLVLEESLTVTTRVGVKVTESRSGVANGEISVIEQGGLVTKRQVREDFESKSGKTLSREELDETVDYQVAGVEHAQIGDNVLLVLGQQEPAARGNSDEFFTYVRLVEADNGEFIWPGKAYNDKWNDRYSFADLAA